MIMSGETSDISQCCDFEWFEWVVLQEKTAPYPDNYFRLGRYLGLIINIGPAKMAKIIKENGQVLYRSIYQALTQDKWEQAQCKAEFSLFMEFLHQRLCPCAMVRDLIELGVEDTPQYDLHEDELQNVETFPILDKEQKVSPESRD